MRDQKTSELAHDANAHSLQRLVSRPSPYYDQDGITIYCGDNRTILPLLDDYDLLLTDPPYGIGQDLDQNSTRRHPKDKVAYGKAKCASKKYHDNIS